jgi:integrase
MRKFVATLQKKGKRDSTNNRSLSALRRMFNLAVKDKKHHKNNVRSFPMLKEPPARQGFFEHENYLALRDALPAYLRPVLAIGYHTGMRFGEIRGLQWEQVDFPAGAIRLRAGETKNDKGRVIRFAANCRRCYARSTRSGKPTAPTSASESRAAGRSRSETSARAGRAGVLS